MSSFLKANVKGNGQQGFPVNLIKNNTVPKLFQYLIKSRPLVSGSPAGYVILFRFREPFKISLIFFPIADIRTVNSDPSTIYWSYVFFQSS